MKDDTATPATSEGRAPELSERAADMLTAYAEMVKATGKYAEMHYIPEIEFVAAELRATRATAPKEPENAAPDGAASLIEPGCPVCAEKLATCSRVVAECHAAGLHRSKP